MNEAYLIKLFHVQFGQFISFLHSFKQNDVLIIFLFRGFKTNSHLKLACFTNLNVRAAGSLGHLRQPNESSC